MQLRSLIRAPKACAIALFLTIVPTSCQTMTPESWASALRPDFSSPEEGGRSFFAAWSAVRPTNEYRCLAESLKKQVGATLDAYMIFRPELERQIGWVGRHAYKLQITGQNKLLNGRVIVWWGRGNKTYLGLEMQAQDFFEFHEAGGKLRHAGGFLDQPLAEHFEFSGKELSLYLENSAVRTARTMGALSKFEIGTEWKISALIPAEEKPVPENTVAAQP